MVKDKIILLLRGLPGSGKSTLAKFLSEDGKYPVLSIDDFFTDSLTGNYEFDFKLNHLAYKKCEEQTKLFARTNIIKIIIHNTFTMDWEMEPYFKIANEHQYSIVVTTVENYHNSKNIHGISDEQIQKMSMKYKVKLY
jgi:predicted kinase